jgi:hypothetical protein
LVEGVAVAVCIEAYADGPAAVIDRETVFALSGEETGGLEPEVGGVWNPVEYVEKEAV